MNFSRRIRLFLCLWRALGMLRKGLAIAVLALALSSVCAQAQGLDRIDVVPGDTEAEITIRFAQKIQYLRHGPQGVVRDLRIFLRLVGGPLNETDLMQDTMRSPKTDRVPFATVIYPELRNGMLVSFSKPTTYVLKVGVDGRSIVLKVPLLSAPKGKAAKSPPPSPTSPPPVVSSPLVATTPSLPAPAALTPPLPPAVIAPATNAVTPTAVEKSAPEPLGEPAAEYQPVQPERSAAETESLAQTYLAEARQALAEQNVTLAINRLNRILGLTGTTQTEAAQALIGEAREANGEAFKAKSEYELYLKNYPSGANVARVKERLAALQGLSAPKPATPVKEVTPVEWSYSGSVSAYYYTGKSQIETLTPPSPGELTFNKETLSMTDQRSLITSINLNARRRDAASDTRIVVRDTDNKNELSPDRSYNRLYSAYVEHNDRKGGYSYRLGRQNPNGMGVLDRFDGAQGGVNLNADWKVNAVVGDAVEFGSTYKKNFYGASVDLAPLSGRPGASLYVIEQNLEQWVNRRAVGTDVRYFDGKFSAFGNVDYDVLYRGINIAMAQANYLDGANNYFISYDYRRAPSYALTNALNAAPGVSLKDMIDAQGIDEVRRQAIGLSALSEMFSLGLSRSISENWQVSTDYRMSSISSTQAVEAVIPMSVVGTCTGTIDAINNTCIIPTAAQAGSGTSHVVTLQTIGNNLFAKSANGVFSVSLIKAPTYNGQAYGFSYVLPVGEVWRFDSNLRYYTQKDTNGNSQNRLSPSLKVAYQWRNSLYIEGEYGEESSYQLSKDQAAGDTDTKIRRDYLYIGLRWDFR